MNNKILCSTGTFIGRANNFDYHLIPEIAAKIDTDEFELMIVSRWDGKLGEVASFLASSGIKFRVAHSDKDIGTKIGMNEPDEALRLFETSPETAVTIGAEKMVLHLWGGYGSDTHFEDNLKICRTFIERSEKAGVMLCIENVPCSLSDPLTHWRALIAEYPTSKYIIDTRFIAFADQYDEILKSDFDFMWNERITHMHISDFVGPAHDFSKLRPIPQPGHGTIDFVRFFGYVAPLYHNTITLESPSLHDDGSIDTDELNGTISLLRKYTLK